MTTHTLWVDFETTSKANLTVEGLQRYVEDPTTEVLCLGWAIGDDDVRCWFPEDGEPFPQAIIDHVNCGGVICAHNATFDRLIWEYVLTADTPDAPITHMTQWQCSAARALAHGLPGSLKNLGIALDLPLQKQAEGTRLINQYSLNGRQPWLDGDKQLMEDYCVMDIRTMRLFCTVLRELTESEWQEYHENERINERGIPIDVAFATAALNYADDVKADADGVIQKITDGEVSSARARKTRDAWLFARITPEQKELLAVRKDGKKKYSLDQEHRDNLLAAPDLNKDVERLIHAIDDAGGSSTSKYKAMANTHVDGRVHHALVWHGAATGRWTSKGIQLHNMPRRAFDEPEELVQDVIGDYEITAPASTLSRLLRAAITSPLGITFGDWAAIEGRVCPWLSDDPDAQPVLDVFRRDEDIYVATAESMGVDDRQAGKVAALSMQFAGGAGALQRMAKVYGVVYTDEEADHLKTLWRTANAWCVRFWYGLRDAAVQAVKMPNVMTSAGRINFQYDGGDWLWMQRPSGGLQGYFQPDFELVTYPWGDEGYELTALAGSVKPKAGEKWPRRTLTPGTFIENATQATAADLMRECVMAASHLPVIGHVHDELLTEGDHREEVKRIMETLPAWADGLPIKADVKYAKRYGK
jgi:DNA polymerase